MTKDQPQKPDATTRDIGKLRDKAASDHRNSINGRPSQASKSFKAGFNLANAETNDHFSAIAEELFSSQKERDALAKRVEELEKEKCADSDAPVIKAIKALDGVKARNTSDYIGNHDAILKLILENEDIKTQLSCVLVNNGKLLTERGDLEKRVEELEAENKTYKGPRLTSAGSQIKYYQGELTAAKQTIQARDAEIAKLKEHRAHYRTLDALLGDNGRVCELHAEIDSANTMIDTLAEALLNYKNGWELQDSFHLSPHRHNNIMGDCNDIARMALTRLAEWRRAGNGPEIPD